MSAIQNQIQKNIWTKSTSLQNFKKKVKYWVLNWFFLNGKCLSWMKIVIRIINITVSIILIILFFYYFKSLSYVPDENATIIILVQPSFLQSGECSLISVSGKKGNVSTLPNGTGIFLFSNIGFLENRITFYNGNPEVTYFSNHEFVGDVT